MKNEMVRRIFIVLLIFSLLFIAACSVNTDSGSDNGDSTTQETITIKYNIAYPPAVYDFEPKKLATEAFKERIEKATDGRVKVELYYSSQLAPASEMMDALSSGLIDMGTYNAHVFGDLVPAAHAFNLPFWAKDEDNALELLNSEYGQILDDELLNYGVKTLFH